jgi:hypothetical protein
MDMGPPQAQGAPSCRLRVRASVLRRAREHEVVDHQGILVGFEQLSGMDEISVVKFSFLLAVFQTRQKGPRGEARGHSAAKDISYNQLDSRICLYDTA